MTSERDYDAAMYEIGEIVRVARDNPAGLRDFLMCNYPKQWGLSKEEHQEILKKPKPSDAEMVEVMARAIVNCYTPPVTYHNPKENPQMYNPMEIAKAALQKLREKGMI